MFKKKNPLMEPIQLPIGRDEFDQFTKYIIKEANITQIVDAKKAERSFRWTLASMIMNTSPTDAFKEPAYFIKALRNAASKETANSMMREMQEEKRREEMEQKSQEMATKPEPVLGVINGAKDPQGSIN